MVCNYPDVQSFVFIPVMMYGNKSMRVDGWKWQKFIVIKIQFVIREEWMSLDFRILFCDNAFNWTVWRHTKTLFPSLAQSLVESMIAILCVSSFRQFSWLLPDNMTENTTVVQIPYKNTRYTCSTKTSSVINEKGSWCHSSVCRSLYANLVQPQ